MGGEPDALVTAERFVDRARVGCLSIPLGALVGLLVAALSPWDPGAGTALLAGAAGGLVLWAVLAKGLQLVALVAVAARERR
jgi:hypothetical protein